MMNVRKILDTTDLQLLSNAPTSRSGVVTITYSPISDNGASVQFAAGAPELTQRRNLRGRAQAVKHSG